MGGIESFVGEANELKEWVRILVGEAKKIKEVCLDLFPGGLLHTWLTCPFYHVYPLQGTSVGAQDIDPSWRGTGASPPMALQEVDAAGRTVAS